MAKILFFLVLVVDSFAVKDLLFKPIVPTQNFHTLYRISTTASYPLQKGSQIASDEYNKFFYTSHFRIIIGKDSESEGIDTLADILEYVWQKEIEEFGFRPPYGSERYYIDVYVGNSGAYNPTTGGYVYIGSQYAGYAISYNNGVPYFVLSPSIDLDVLKVTIAHEFFHTVQYAYLDADTLDRYWDENVWWLEASAVMMEDLVYPNINDYINYLDDYFEHTYYPLDFYNGNVEYGKAVVAQFLLKRFGLDFIKEIFTSWNRYGNFITDIDALLHLYNSSLQDEMLIFGTHLVHKEEYFDDGYLFPALPLYSIDKNIYVGHFGFVPIYVGENYLVGSAKEYKQIDFYGHRNKLARSTIFLNIGNNIIKSALTRYNLDRPLEFRKGWNLFSNIADETLQLSILFPNQIVWVYRDGSYYLYTNDESLQLQAKKLLIPTTAELYAGEAAWVLMDKNTTMEYSIDTLIDCQNLKSGWNMSAVCSNATYAQSIDAKIVWSYSDGNWSYFSKEYELNLSRIDVIKPKVGYFILLK